MVDTGSPSEAPLAPVAMGVPWGSPPRGPQPRLSAVAVAALLPLGGLAAVGTPEAAVGALGAAPRPTKGIKGPLADVELVGTLHLVHLPAVAQRRKCPRSPGPWSPAMVPGEVAPPGPQLRRLITSPSLLAFDRCRAAPGLPCRRQRGTARCFSGARPTPGITVTAVSPYLASA